MRLIDADELKKVIDGYDYSEEDYSDRMDFKFIYEVIDNEPTAYDLDKVVKELEDMKLVRVEQCHEDYEIEVMTESNFDDAIEIVKRGGKND